MHLIPQSWSHVHILIGVFPTVGFLFGLGVYVAGLLTGNDLVRRVCLAMFGMLGLLSIPIYVSGIRSMADLSGNSRFSRDAIATHYVWGMVALAITCNQRSRRRHRAVAIMARPPSRRRSVPSGIGTYDRHSGPDDCRGRAWPPESITANCN